MIWKSASPLVFICLFVFARPSPASVDDAPLPSVDETPPLRLSLGNAMGNATASTIAAGRYGRELGVGAGVWLRDRHIEGPTPDVFVRIDYMWTLQRWRIGFGPTWLNELSDINGTHWNFGTSIAYDITDHVSIEMIHFSHGKGLGIRKDAANGGWTFIGFGLKL